MVTMIFNYYKINNNISNVIKLKYSIKYIQMSFATFIAGIFRKFKHALGWFLIELLGLVSSSALIFLILWALYSIY